MLLNTTVKIANVEETHKPVFNIKICKKNNILNSLINNYFRVQFVKNLNTVFFSRYTLKYIILSAKSLENFQVRNISRGYVRIIFWLNKSSKRFVYGAKLKGFSLYLDFSNIFLVSNRAKTKHYKYLLHNYFFETFKLP